ncbi:MAG: endo-1,4-beta-xylanase [Fibrobacter sp.]|nr:endo-1,4-beta-xylanase [Fibrobacter sp.]
MRLRKMKVTQFTHRVVLVAALIGIGASVAGAQETLRSLAEERGRYIGAILNSEWFRGGLPADYERIHKTEFNAVVAENEMKFDATEGSQGQFSYGNGDKMVNYAKQNNMYARGHALAWHSQVPGWVNSHRNKQELLGILKNHINKVVGHWKGSIKEWDVVNEAVNDNNTHGWRSQGSVWFETIGAEFLDSAFVWAHAADPDAELCYNDYAIEQGIGPGSKAGFVLDQVKRWVKDGIPITCVGSQTHVEDVTTAKEFIGAPDSLRHFAQELAKLGIKLNITELDVGFKSGRSVSAEDLARQGQVYRQFMDVFLEEPNMGVYLIWGISDKWSWLSQLQRQKGLIYDENLKKKPAYDSIVASFKAHPPETVKSPYKDSFVPDTTKKDSTSTPTDSTQKADSTKTTDTTKTADSTKTTDSTKTSTPGDSTQQVVATPGDSSKVTAPADSTKVGDDTPIHVRRANVPLAMNLAGRTLSVTVKGATVEVFNLQGRPVFSGKAVDGSVSLSSMNSGLYVVRVKSGSSSLVRRVVLK